MKKATWKRNIALILVIVFVAGLLPLQAHAATVDYNANSSNNATITVKDKSTDAAITGATVTVTQGSNTHTVVEVGNGQYKFTKASGGISFLYTYSISVSAPGYETGTGSVGMFSSSATIELTPISTEPEIPEETEPTVPEETTEATTEPTSPSEPSEPEEEVTVKIVSFMRGEQSDLRSSELLLAQVEGYSGNELALTYKWYNNLGTSVRNYNRTTYYTTYLYVYDSHNMYTVQNTVHEQEIYNSDMNQDGMDAMVSDGRSHDKSFSGVGYAYASVYGANIDDERQYNEGNITVEVYDGNKLLATATYSGFEGPDLQADLDEAVFGVFETESIPVRDLLGESAILHIACAQCTVTDAQIVSGSQYILVDERSPEGSNEPEYHVTGLQKGVAQIEISVDKNNCKFHQYTDGVASPQVHVFKKPVVTPGVTTLNLTNLDPDCTYYIGGVEGTLHEDGTYTFDGLNPSTTYEIEVHGHYDDHGEEKIVYTFVYGTTLDLNVGSVVIRLDNVLIPGEKVDVSGVVLKPLDGSDKTYEMTFNEDSMSYNGEAPDGAYGVYDKDGNRLGDDLELIIDKNNTTAVVDFYTVTYEPNGGTLETTQLVTVLPSGEAVTTTQEKPIRSGYRFTGWSYSDSLYQPQQQVTEGIETPIVLTAQWEAVVVIFHSNNADAVEQDVFRTYYPADSGQEYVLTQEGKLPEIFYDIPTFDYMTHNQYVFAGWYTEPDETGVPISWQQVYELVPGGETHIYAHWLETGEVAQEEDGKTNVGSYNGFDLIGTQIRTILKDKEDHYGDVDSGLRFITVLSEELWAGVQAVNAQNDAAAQYGFLLCKEATAQKYTEDQLLYKAANSNGRDTTQSHAFLNNVKCNGVTDHFNGVGYRLYTMVVTYKNMEGAQLDAAMAQKLVARAYLGYYDANGLYRYHYNNYTGDQIYHGCCSSYADALALTS